MPFDPDQLDPVLWEVMDRLQGDLGRLEVAVEGLNRGSLDRLGWTFELAGSALTGTATTRPCSRKFGVVGRL